MTYGSLWVQFMPHENWRGFSREATPQPYLCLITLLFYSDESRQPEGHSPFRFEIWSKVDALGLVFISAYLKQKRVSFICALIKSVVDSGHPKMSTFDSSLPVCAYWSSYWEIEAISSPLTQGRLCDLLWSTECSGSDVLIVLSPDLKCTGNFLSFQLEAIYHVRSPATLRSSCCEEAQAMHM